MFSKKIKKLAKLINRQRTNPKIWDYSYLLLKNNLSVFQSFRDLIIRENKTKILDVGCGFKPWAELFDRQIVEYIGIDFDESTSLADFTDSADKLSFKDNEFDGLIYSEVIEHISNLPEALKEMRRVIKKGGLVFISSPFVFPQHGIPYDFQRLTRFYYENIFKNDEIILIKESNSSLTTSITSFNLFIESSPFQIFMGIKHLIYTINNLVSIIFDALIVFIFSRIGKNYKKYFYLMPLGYSLIVRIKK